jgi:hypothetical protein
MRHEVRERETLTITLAGETVSVRMVRVRGRTATVLVESRNWHVQSEVEHPKRERGRSKPRKIVDYDRDSGLD